jgi:CheY-like chemotaxis protein/HPt (histidine-containing phosphotransfer) domain-containing protein
VFVSSQFSDKIIAFIEQRKLRTVPVTLTEIGEVEEIDRVSLGMPAHTVSIANLLNGIAVVDSREEISVRFTAPDAHLLVVDDIEVNLNVAKGLLSMYQPQIDVCTRGQRAIDLVKKHQYDIVFMDHMMPEMDGIETTETIRNLDVEYAKTIPIVALTANAVVGMKEMFLKKGFDDYLSKPLEIAKLNAVMEKWIPKEKRVPALQQLKLADDIKSAEELFAIEGVDAKLGIRLTGGTEKGYRDVLKQFCVDAEARFFVFASVPERGQLALFATQAHALKSALAVIGASDISKEAARLEEAGKNGNIAAIQESLPVFYEHLVRITRSINLALAEKNVAAESEKKVRTVKAASVPQLSQLKIALAEKSIRQVDRLIRELEKSPFDEKTKKIIDDIADSVLMSNYNEAIQMVDDLLAMN